MATVRFILILEVDNSKLSAARVRVRNEIQFMKIGFVYMCRIRIRFHP